MNAKRVTRRSLGEGGYASAGSAEECGGATALAVGLHYKKGCSIACLAHQRLQESGVKGGLNAVMAYLYKKHSYFQTGKKISEGDIQAAFKSVTGKDWKDFFSRYVYGLETVPKPNE